MRKLLIMSAVVLGMAALTTTEVMSQQPPRNDGGDMDPNQPMPPRPGGYPWDWKPWENPQNPKP